MQLSKIVVHLCIQQIAYSLNLYFYNWTLRIHTNIIHAQNRIMSCEMSTLHLLFPWYILLISQYPKMHSIYHIILSYAFKMRQDYLSTSYLDQKYLPSERSETREIWIDPSNVCWDNPVSFWIHMIFFSHFSLFNRWNILKIWEKMSKWNLDGGPSHLRASYVLTT